MNFLFMDQLIQARTPCRINMTIGTTIATVFSVVSSILLLQIPLAFDAPASIRHGDQALDRDGLAAPQTKHFAVHHELLFTWTLARAEDGLRAVQSLVLLRQIRFVHHAPYVNSGTTTPASLSKSDPQAT
jgi:hypothetical protein